MLSAVMRDRTRQPKGPDINEVKAVARRLLVNDKAQQEPGIPQIIDVRIHAISALFYPPVILF